MEVIKFGIKVIISTQYLFFFAIKFVRSGRHLQDSAVNLPLCVEASVGSVKLVSALYGSTSAISDLVEYRRNKS